MKIRNGFVSNSSSSSFICNICGRVESGYDVSYNDVGICQCAFGHTMCQDEVSEFVKSAKLEEAFEHYENEETEDEDGNPLEQYEGDWPCEFDTRFCPICQMHAIDRDDLLPLLLKTNGLTEKQFMADIKERFASFADLRKFIYDK